uniref:Geraniol 8-hydroxylase n=1 Tax=Ananas comosus var. bracteatus TaxID=296719 RepID=A0A6V7QQ03_ANACO|nr:unnamed protein product [Ananas comosus var. bracteatus]
MLWLPVDQQWRNLRKLVNTELFSSQRLDDLQALRHKKARELVAHLREKSLEGKLVDVGGAVYSTTVNTISNLLFSVDVVNPSSEAPGSLKEIMRGVIEEIANANISDFIPFFAALDLQGRRRRLADHFRRLHELLDKVVDQRIQENAAEGTYKDFLEAIIHRHTDGKGLNLDKHTVDTLLGVIKMRAKISSVRRAEATSDHRKHADGRQAAPPHLCSPREGLRPDLHHEVRPGISGCGRFLPGDSLRGPPEAGPALLRRWAPDAAHMLWLPVDQQWRNLRKLVNTELASSQRLDDLQALRHKKARELVAYLREKSLEGKPVDVGGAVYSTTVNTISNSNLIFSVDVVNPSSEAPGSFKEIMRG